ncbi:DUF1566 domain-containing protein [Durusdinium trenchii]|uniref:DUF1566 domain-containing protein n=1 Tax=Durusdinium trenchii TaxID=1381693 RepID=A0ABP0LJS4_9DINO
MLPADLLPKVLAFAPLDLPILSSVRAVSRGAKGCVEAQWWKDKAKYFKAFVDEHANLFADDPEMEEEEEDHPEMEEEHEDMTIEEQQEAFARNILLWVKPLLVNQPWRLEDPADGAADEVTPQVAYMNLRRALVNLSERRNDVLRDICQQARHIENYHLSNGHTIHARISQADRRQMEEPIPSTYVNLETSEIRSEDAMSGSFVHTEMTRDALSVSAHTQITSEDNPRQELMNLLRWHVRDEDQAWELLEEMVRRGYVVAPTPIECRSENHELVDQPEEIPQDCPNAFPAPAVDQLELIPQDPAADSREASPQALPDAAVDPAEEILQAGPSPLPATVANQPEQITECSPQSLPAPAADQAKEIQQDGLSPFPAPVGNQPEEIAEHSPQALPDAAVAPAEEIPQAGPSPLPATVANQPEEIADLYSPQALPAPSADQVEKIPQDGPSPILASPADQPEEIAECSPLALRTPVVDQPEHTWGGRPHALPAEILQGGRKAFSTRADIRPEADQALHLAGQFSQLSFVLALPLLLKKKAKTYACETMLHFVAAERKEMQRQWAKGS